MCFCTDGRWPRHDRVMCVRAWGFVLPVFNPPSLNPQRAGEAIERRRFHHRLSLQAGAYQNATWVASVAKAGCEEGVDMLGGSVIVAPTGEIVAQASTRGDELIVADCDLDACAF